jgi:hypothetical protein
MCELGWAITGHMFQGAETTKTVCIMQSDFTWVTRQWMYVCLSRVKAQEMKDLYGKVKIDNLFALRDTIFPDAFKAFQRMPVTKPKTYYYYEKWGISKETNNQFGHEVKQASQ